MSERKINLEEILSKEFEGISLLSTTNAREVTLNAIKNAMLEFGKQLLELASENAYIEVDSKNEGDTYITIIAGESCETYIELNKQSILDTIKQVE